MSGAAVKAPAVVAADDGAFVAFSPSEVDRAGSPRHQRDERWLVALAEDAQRAVPTLEAKILDVGPYASDTRRPFSPRSTASAAWE